MTYPNDRIDLDEKTADFAAQVVARRVLQHLKFRAEYIERPLTASVKIDAVQANAGHDALGRLVYLACDGWSNDMEDWARGVLGTDYCERQEREMSANSY